MHFVLGKNESKKNFRRKLKLMEYKKVKKYILNKLENELPEHLSYHSVAHVLDVINAAKQIAAEEGVEGDDLTLLATAALFHDTGFVFGSKNHELKSCDLAAEFLPQYGYTEEQIKMIQDMIMATQIPQNPKTHLEKILADADLDYLGRDDFFVIGDKLYAELAMFGVISNENDWNRLQLKFLKSHHYHTQTSIQKRTEKKQENMEIIKSKLVD